MSHPQTQNRRVLAPNRLDRHLCRQRGGPPMSRVPPSRARALSLMCGCKEGCDVAA